MKKGELVSNSPFFTPGGYGRDEEAFELKLLGNNKFTIVKIQISDLEGFVI